MADPWSLVAEAVNARRIQLGLSWKKLAEKSQVSESTLEKLRLRYIPIASDAKRAQLANALEWEADSIQRLLAGLEPGDLRRPETTIGGSFDRVADALDALRQVQAEQTAVIRALVEELRSRPPGSSIPPPPR